jgi:hypothetical protein
MILEYPNIPRTICLIRANLIYFGNISRILCQVTSSDSGKTRVSAMVVMKLVSPDQRGNACK